MSEPKSKPDSEPGSTSGNEPGSKAGKPAEDSHCGSCGAPYGASATWPRTCAACGGTAYRNPLPVAVALLPVTDRGGTALVVITRTIPPHRGGLALPGGYIDHDEDWRHAVVRELDEETGIAADEREVRLADAFSAPDGHLLLFGLLPARPAASLPPSGPTAETSGHQLLRTPTELAFPLHTRAVRTWFDGGYR
ncbi:MULTISPECIES: NUDIX domain-containing protein [unclassified Streptomyces]|uniref:NUDIX domain-containing protein n=1 Tax=unclassified Streptomyces TaxID=2593676 RepID=UPI00382C770B